MITSQSQPSSSPDTLGADDSGFPYMTLENIQPTNVPEMNYALDLFDIGNFDSSETSSGLINIPLISMTSIPLYSINSPTVGEGKTINMLSIEDATLRPLNGQGKVSEMNSLDTMPASVLQKKIDDALAAGTKEIVIDQIVAIGPGEVVDGKGIKIIASSSMGDGSQSEIQLPMFEIEDGILKNISLTGENGGGAADGIHTFGNEVTIDNIHVEDVGEDAITVKNAKNLNVLNSSFKKASDKIIQVNNSSNVNIDNVTTSENEKSSKFLRINGGQMYNNGTVTISNSNIDNPDATIGIDYSRQGYTIIDGGDNELNGRVWEKIFLPTIKAIDMQKEINDAIARGETEIILNKMIDIRPGEMLDGRGITIIAGPLFEEVAKLNNATASKLVRIEDGSLQNMNFTGINDTAPADGIHAYGNYANIDNVHFDTIGSDAITGQNIKNLTITNSSFTGAEDKVIRISAATNIVIDNVTSYDNGANSSFLRINGGKDYDGGILTITNSDINNAKGVVGIDDTGQGYTISNTENTNNIHGTPWKDIYSTAPVNPTTVAPEDITSLNNSKT